MKSVILAGGGGKRWFQSGGTCPKQLARINGAIYLLTKTIINQMYLPIYVILGYRSHEIHEAITHELNKFGEKYILNNLHFIYNDKWNTYGTGYALLKASNTIGSKEPFILSSADQIVMPQVYKILGKCHEDNPAYMYAAGSTVCLSSTPQNIFPRVAIIDNDKLSLKRQFKISYTLRIDIKEVVHFPFLWDMGVYLLNPTIFDILDKEVSKGNTDFADVLKKSTQINAVTMFPFDKWYNINTIDDFKNYEENEYVYRM